MTYQLRCPLRHHPHTTECYQLALNQMADEVQTLKASLKIATETLEYIAMAPMQATHQARMALCGIPLDESQRDYVASAKSRYPNWREFT